MRKLLFLVSLSCILASCSTTTTLYSWDDYVNSSYKYYKETNAGSCCRLDENV